MIRNTSNEEESKRLNLCNSCEFSKKVFNSFDICSKCNCVILTKIKLASASCPENKWFAEV